MVDVASTRQCMGYSRVIWAASAMVFGCKTIVLGAAFELSWCPLHS